MTNFDNGQLTQQVIRSFDQTPDPRLKTLMVELVDCLHGFVRKTGLTFEEWQHAIQFLTKTGQTCTPVRQEFILLSDVLGVSMLVDAINHRDRGGASETTVLGPFYVGEHKLRESGSNIAPGVPGEPMFVEACVTSIDGTPLDKALVDVWHADPIGLYDSQKEAYAEEGPSLRARFQTGADGMVSFRTIKPNSYPIPTDGPVGQLVLRGHRPVMRPAHIHFLINPAGYEPLVTHVFIDGDEHLRSDVVFGVKDDLIAAIERHDGAVMPDGTPAPGPWYKMNYTFRLRPGSGTVPQPMAAE